ncbi:glycoside hydrolase family 127 protein [uncultured Sunxiuqinia sp.]|uniref:glycoside hydrolase family 127 protein n=1 Tax=uncultured Sunxiuqinia sp. TaxID=1573825 RepID=UPI002AA78071|nr:glycoside hydrolase family 127 protein [uncultured Sunxiuqinia sp.]
MNMRSLLLLLLICFYPLALLAQSIQLQSFHLSDVELLDSPFKQAMYTDMQYMLEMDVDRLLAPYLREAGLAPQAESYTNWENTGLGGHIGGHYLSALAMMYAATGDERMKERMDYMVSELKHAQDQHEDGYLGGVPGGRAMWEEIADGNIDAGSFSLNKKWVPLYNIHKIYTGLRDAYWYGENEVAKEMLIELTDWAIQLVSSLNEEEIQDMLRSEHGGLNEVFADVAVITGDEKYLKLARQFSHESVLKPLLEHEDHLTGMHANTQIPKVIGYKRIADVEGNESWSEAARFFWETVVKNRSVSIGGNSVREHFNPGDDFSTMITSEQGPETCNTYNMLKLTKLLFLSDPKGEYMDYYERALYNHILSTQNPDHGGFVYFTPMRPGHYRVYSQPETSFWCCVGSGLENHTKYGEMIYAYDDDDLYVNLFIPSKLNWEDKQVEVIQQTNFPDEATTQLTVNPKSKQEFTLNIRYPSWVREGELSITINGEEFDFVAQPETYVTINRTWKKGDVVEVKMPMHTHVEQLPDGEAYYTILHGPIVLAAKTDTADMEGLYADDSRGGHIAHGEKYPLQDMPVIISQPDAVVGEIHPVAGEALTFTIDNLEPKKYADLNLIPFFRLHESRYVIYWQVETAEEYEKMQQELAAEEAAQQQLALQTIDLVFPGEQQPESDHFIESEKSQVGVNQGRHWRDARGWFSYQLKDEKKEAKKLLVMYFGLDNNRHFTILVNGELIAEVNLDGSKGFEFFREDYAIPEEIVEQSGGRMRVKFEAKDGSIVGGVYEVRLIK